MNRPTYIYTTQFCVYYFSTRRISSIDESLVRLRGDSHVLNVTEGQSFVLKDLTLCKNRFYIVKKYYQ